MEETIAVRDVMDRSFVGVSEGDPVAGAAGLMHEEGVDSAIVLRGDEPVGMLRANDILALVATGDDPRETTVGDIMADSVVSVETDAGLDEVVDAITGDGIRRVIATEDGTVEGIITAHDVITARTILPEEPDPGVREPTDDVVVESEVYGSQGVCELCGSLTRELTEDNGRLVCGDCLEV